jgi:hypothetical protein
VHHYSPHTGPHLLLFAGDGHGHLVAVRATAPDLTTTAHTRILDVPAGALTCRAVPDQARTYRAVRRGHTYTLTAAVGDEPRRTVTSDDGAPAHYADLDDALTAALPHPLVRH